MASSLYMGDAINQNDKKWYMLSIWSLNNIADRKEESLEELLEAIRYIRNHTINDGGNSYSLDEAEKKIKNRE